MSWLILILAGVLETLWAIGLKYTHGFTKPVPTLCILAIMGASVFLLAVAMKNLPTGTAYAIWTGIGTVGAVVLGIVLFGEPASLPRLACLGLIIAGVAGLKLVS